MHRQQWSARSDSLERGEGATITIRARVLDAAVDSAVTNTATVTDAGASEDPSLGNNSAGALVDVPLSSDLLVTKSFTPTPNPTAGDLVTYTVTVDNTGPSPAENVVVADVLPEDFYDPTFTPTGDFTGGTCDWVPEQRLLLCENPLIGVGDIETITIEARLASDSRGKTVVNNVGAISDSVDPNPALAQDTVSFVPIPAADLELSKQGPPDPVAPGGVGRYTFRVANRGPSGAPDVTVRDTLPSGLTFVGDAAGACSAVGQALTCSLGELLADPDGLDPAAVREFGVDVRVSSSLAGQTLRNDASVASEPSDPTLAPAEVVPSSNFDADDLVVAPLPEPPPPEPPPGSTPPAGGQPRLVLEKSVRGAGARVGDQLVWSVRVRNDGNAPARDVVLADRPGRGLTVIGAQPSAGSCADLRCELGDLAAGATAEVVLRTRATRHGRRVNAAEVSTRTAQAPGAVLDARATARVRRAVVRLAKASSRGRVQPGGLVRFTLTARSRARATLTGVRVCDRLPAGLTFVAAKGARYRNGRACWTLRLRAGQTRRLTVVARTARLNRTRRLRNVATLRGTTVGAASARAGVTVVARPDRGGVTG